jgi:hypothetical protein
MTPRRAASTPAATARPTRRRPTSSRPCASRVPRAARSTLTYESQTTAPIAYNATGAVIDAALEALSNIEANEIQTSGGPVQNSNVNVFFRRGKQQADQAQITADGVGLR